jgi:hypothetical protein
MMAGGHGSMACMAQEYHGDGDVDGSFYYRCYFYI